MFNTKLWASILLVFAVMITQVGNVAAAPQAQDGTTTTLTGTIKEITTELDANGETIVVVKLLDGQGVTQTVTLTVQEAADNNLFDPATQELLAQAGDTVELTVDPNDVVPDESTSDEDIHPIAQILAKFFDVDPSIVNGYHEDGFGFGVIAQALWMSRNLTGTEDEAGNAFLAEDILQAKRDKDYATFFESHPEYREEFGDTLPTNWGQFKKVLKEKKNNLGVIVSGQEDPANSTTPLTEQNKDNGKNKDKDKGKGKDHKKNKP